MHYVIERCEQRLQTAHKILTQLQLLQRWSAFGRPILVGAVAYELAMAPDIDIEIYCDEPRIEDGFTILCDCAIQLNVRNAHFGNYLNDSDQGLYWRLIYRTEDGTDWKIDMWSMRYDHPGPCARHLVEPLRRALTPERRLAILELKAQIQDGQLPHYPSIDIYRAVIDGNVRNAARFEAWVAQHPRPFLTFWLPNVDANEI